ncbi:hypothetical protein phiOC_p115 [Ochrobactrum phage vB_OspM_OC]|nr:hypothetical protein phiOC_p115 [Ochrobactrum phage vB_OspM_OC]
MKKLALNCLLSLMPAAALILIFGDFSDSKPKRIYPIGTCFNIEGKEAKAYPVSLGYSENDGYTFLMTVKSKDLVPVSCHKI